MEKKSYIAGVNENTSNLLFSDSKYIQNISETDYYKILLINQIENITMCEKYDKNSNQICLRNLNKKIKNLVIGNQGIKFSLLSDVFCYEAALNELLSEERLGTCHIRTIFLAHFFKNSNLVTGKINYSNFNILHSVIETNIDGTLYILDWTKNLVIEKTLYYYLTNFEEIEKINCNEITKSMYFLKQIQTHMKLFLVFNKAFINDINKNSFLFEPQKSKKTKIKRIKK